MKKMKNFKTMSMLLSLMLLVSTIFTLQAQQSETLKRDMEVTSNLLSTLLRTNSGNSFMALGSNGIETSYNEGFGVLFDLKSGNLVFSSSAEYFTLNSPNEVNIKEVDLKIESIEEDSIRPVNSMARSSQTFIESMSSRVVPDQQESIKEFLIEYGSFLKDLKQDERIMVQFPYTKVATAPNSKGNEIAFLNFNTDRKATKSFTIFKKDADAYRNGSITKEEALSRIEMEENLPEEIATDLRVLGDLMNSLYREQNSNTYFSTSNPSIIRTKGIGVVYSWAVYSAYSEGMRFRLPTLGALSVDDKGRNELVKAAYPVFLENFKENLVDYGRTIKSLNDNEKIIFNIKMTKCDGCGIPEVVKVEMDRTTIEEYNQGKLTRVQAISRLKVIEK